jgi:arginyl-tRNA synthetase
MIKQKLGELVEQALFKAIGSGKLGALESVDVPVVIERPRLPEHGDFACGSAMKLAGKAKMPPLKIAEAISAELTADAENVAKLEVAPPGFINFRLQQNLLAETLSAIHSQGDNFGRSNSGKGDRINIEYVSANPTGDLHIGHARGAVFGSCLANLFRFAGAEVEEEFYINDAGEQIAQLGRNAFAIYQRLQGKDVPYPQEGYPEDMLVHFVEKVVKEHGDKFLSLEPEAGAAQVGALTKQVILDDQRHLLERMGIHFKRWFSEKTLHDSGAVPAVLERFKQQGTAYDAGGALWLKAKQFGDERDRVLRKSEAQGGKFTYLAADAAYHLDKFKRGYDLCINIWGADHHGQVPGLKASMEALGEDPQRLEVVLTQIVNLSRDGEIVRMSKRRGTVVLLEELVDEVGVDAVRYYLAESNPQNPISFDLELAKKTGRENPAFYIQYAHARCASILRRALEPSVDAESGNELQPAVSEADWKKYLAEYKNSAEVFVPLFDADPGVFAHQKALVMRLDSFPEEVEEAVSTRTPGRIARYAYDVANDLQKFYEVSRVITDQEAVTKARLGLIVATRQVLANALGIIAVTAPERM